MLSVHAGAWLPQYVRGSGLGAAVGRSFGAHHIEHTFAAVTNDLAIGGSSAARPQIAQAKRPKIPERYRRGTGTPGRHPPKWWLNAGVLVFPDQHPLHLEKALWRDAQHPQKARHSLEGHVLLAGLNLLVPACRHARLRRDVLLGQAQLLSTSP